MPATSPVTPRKRTTKTQTKSASPRSKSASSRSMDSHAEMRVYEVRAQQRSEGHFDCFGKAHSGFCDQSDCMYQTECIDLSRAALS